jgi:N-acetylmuramoyl-L-alanine amidase
METNSPAQPPQSKKRWDIIKVSFINLQIVIGVAIVLATLFTAWTPGETAQNPTWEISQIVSLPTQQPTSGPTPTPRLQPLIGIVSGHWGNDSGAVCPDGLTEAEVNQNIATLVQKQLISKGFEVDLLKEFDPRLTGYQASALVSIHSDSCNYVNDQATGFKVAAAMASPDPERATRLTACLRARYAQATGLPLHSTSVTADMTDYHAFGEISESTIAAIIETGFLNLDRQFLTEKADLAAQGIANGILCYLNNENITANIP